MNLGIVMVVVAFQDREQITRMDHGFFVNGKNERS